MVVGTRDKDGVEDVVLLRYRADGSLDSSLNGSGRRVLSFSDGARNVGSGVALDLQGRILVGGTRTNASGSVIAVARLVPDGALDTTFNGNGKRFVDFGLSNGTNATGSAIAVQDDGKIVVAGTRTGAGGSDFAVARLNPDDFGADEAARALAVQRDGKVVAVGERQGPNGRDFAVARYFVDGTPDPALDGDGKLRIDLGGEAADSAQGVALQGDDRIVIGGTSTVGGAADVALVRRLATVAGSPGVLEIPRTGSKQSGIGRISGWLCNAPSVGVRIDGKPLVTTAYGTTRGDTASVCGDTNNGFGLLVSWSLLGDGPHTIEVRADGAVLGTATFTVTTLGTSFLRGASGFYTLPGFPDALSSVDVAWDEGQQGFVVVGMR